MKSNEQQQGVPERQIDPHRQEDLDHQLDAYPLKDEAQRQRLIEAIHADQPDAEQPSADVSANPDNEGP